MSNYTCMRIHAQFNRVLIVLYRLVVFHWEYCIHILYIYSTVVSTCIRLKLRVTCGVYISTWAIHKDLLQLFAQILPKSTKKTWLLARISAVWDFQHSTCIYRLCELLYLSSTSYSIWQIGPIKKMCTFQCPPEMERIFGVYLYIWLNWTRCMALNVVFVL